MPSSRKTFAIAFVIALPGLPFCKSQAAPDPGERLSAARLVLSLSPHTSPTPGRVAPANSAAAPDMPSSSLREAVSALASFGWDESSVQKRISAARERLSASLVRPMSRKELRELSPHYDADLAWLSIDGPVILRRPSQELDAIASGLNLARSYGLTSSGADLASKTSLPVLGVWAEASHPKSATLTALLSSLWLLTASASALLFVLVSPRERGVRTLRAIRTASVNFALSCAMSSLVSCLTPPPGGWTTLLFLAAPMALALKSLSPIPSPENRRSTLYALILQPALLVPSWLAFEYLHPALIGGYLMPAASYGLGYAVTLFFAGKTLPAKSSFTVFSTFASAMMLLSPMIIYFEKNGYLLIAGFLGMIPTTQSAFSAEGMALPVLLSSAAVLIFWAACMLMEGRLEVSSAPPPTDLDRSIIPTLAAALVFSLTAAVVTVPSQPSSTSKSASWQEAMEAERTGSGLIVDARPPGTPPEIPSSANLDPDSTEESLRDFCDFASGKKIFVFCASSLCDVSADLADRLNKICTSGAVHIEGGAETWQKQ